MELKGKINSVSDVQSGTSNQGKEWQKLSFTIDTGEKYDNIISFDIFGQEDVEKFLKYNKVGKDVEVSFNIKCREYQGKYFTNLQAWRVFGGQKTEQQVEENENDLPF